MLRSKINRLRAPLRSAFERLPRPLKDILWRRTPAELFRRRRALVTRGQTIQALAACQQGNSPGFLFLPNHTWFSTHFQRPQQMARALADIGCHVVYCEPWRPAHLPTAEAARERRFVGVRNIGANLSLLRWPDDDLPELLRQAWSSALLMTWPDQANFVDESSRSPVIYEMIDDHELLPGVSAEWRATHLRWVRDADVMVVTADDLYGHLAPQRPDVLLLHNGVRLEDWTDCATSDIPADLVQVRRAPVVVAYTGTLAEWFDWELLRTAAQLRPQWSFVLIGPQYPERPEEISRQLAASPNIYYLGPKAYQSLCAYLAHIDVAMIPFLLNNITHACSPVKLFEYMAAGRPIVATPMREILKYRSVLFAQTADQFVQQVEAALNLRNDATYRASLRDEAQANTWRSRATALRNALEASRRENGDLPRRARAQVAATT